MIPKFLRPERVPYASVEILPAPPEAPERHRDLTPAMDQQRCVCGVRFPRHFDGWDGTRLSCAEAVRRHGVSR